MPGETGDLGSRLSHHVDDRKIHQAGDVFENFRRDVLNLLLSYRLGAAAMFSLTVLVSLVRGRGNPDVTLFSF